jgi:formate dehydrogenase maturation protein FdhE
MTKKAIIIIAEDGQDSSMDTNGVSYQILYRLLGAFQKHCAQEVVKQAETLFPNDQKRQERWIENVMNEDIKNDNLHLN